MSFKFDALQAPAAQLDHALIARLSCRRKLKPITSAQLQRPENIAARPHSLEHDGLIQQLQILFAKILMEILKGAPSHDVALPPEADERKGEGGPEDR